MKVFAWHMFKVVLCTQTSLSSDSSDKWFFFFCPLALHQLKKKKNSLYGIFALWEGFAKKNGAIFSSSGWNSVLLDFLKSSHVLSDPWILHRGYSSAMNFFRLVTWSKHFVSSIGTDFSPRCLRQPSNTIPVRYLTWIHPHKRRELLQIT